MFIKAGVEKIMTELGMLKRLHNYIRDYDEYRILIDRFNDSLGELADSWRKKHLPDLAARTAIAGEEGGWTRVENGLPPYNSKYYYWLYSESIDNYEQGEYDYDRKYFVDKRGERLHYVSHWKLPTPPSDKQTK